MPRCLYKGTFTSQKQQNPKTKEETKNGVAFNRQVWQYNLEKELYLIKQTISRFPVFSFDTEFLGTVIHPPPDIPKYLYSSHPPDYTYSLMKENIDILNLIQLGLTLSHANGNLPDFSTPFCYVWQFNFDDFDPKIHSFDPKSIELLLDQGTNFSNNKIMGIDSRVFSEKIMGIDSRVFSERFRILLALNALRGMMGHGYVTWVTFHRTYVLGLLIKILTRKELPNNLETLMMSVKYFFGVEVYDLKVMVRCLGLQGSLVRVAKDFGVERTTGLSHQVGSDNLLIMQTFSEMRKRCLTPFNKK